jgi:hypothetical protein
MSSRTAMEEIISNSEIFDDTVFSKKNRVHEQIRKERKSKQRVRTGQTDKGYSDPVGHMLGIVEKHFEHKGGGKTEVMELIESLEFDIRRLRDAVKLVPIDSDIENKILLLASRIKGIVG